MFWSNYGLSNDGYDGGAVMRGTKNGAPPSVLVSNEKSAYGLVADKQYVYYGTLNYNRIVNRVDPKSAVVTPLTGYEAPGIAQLALDREATALFWIRPFNATGFTSIRGTVVPGPGTPSDLTFDDHGQFGFVLAVDEARVFFSAGGTGSGRDQLKAIPRAGCPDAGSCGTIIVADAFLGAIAVDETFVYWGDRAKGTIERARKSDDGKTEHTVLVTGLRSPRMLLLDGEWLYYTDHDADGTVGRMRRDGSQKSVLAAHVLNPWGLAVDATALYWVASGTTALPADTHDLHDGKILRLAK